MAITCTQMSALKGLKECFGKDAEEALMHEWLQFDKLLEVYFGAFASSLTPLKCKRALHLVQLIKLKKNCTLTGEMCTDHRKQCACTLVDDASSPTVFNEALLLTCITDAKEHHKMVTADVPQAFLHAKIDDVIHHVMIEGEQLAILLKPDTSYAQHITKDPCMMGKIPVILMSK